MTKKILITCGLIFLLLLTVKAEQESKPFNNTPQQIPGFIKASYFDTGGESIAYHDNEAKNKTAKTIHSFRSSEGVDCNQHTVGYISPGEWLKYTVNVQKSQEYDAILSFGRSTSYKGPTSIINLFIDGKKTSHFTVNKGTGPNWGIKGHLPSETKIRLSAGLHKLKLVFEGGAVNFAGIIFKKATSAEGSLSLPKTCTVFAPIPSNITFTSKEFLTAIPENIQTDKGLIEGKRAQFDNNCALNLAPLIAPEGQKAAGKRAYVYIPFQADKTEPVTFGFGADWWYDAYLDGTLISSTMAKGNDSWPPAIHDHTKTVNVTEGNHILVIHFKSGKGSSMLTVGGAAELRDPNISKVKTINHKAIRIPIGNYRQGPPAGKNWKMIWHDEFNGTNIDSEKWGEKECGKWKWPGIKTINDSKNTYLDGKGHLILALTKDKNGTVHYGNSLYSKNLRKAYGYFEARVQFSKQPGWWTAFWLSGVPYSTGRDNFISPQEFDIYEDFYKPKTAKGNDIQQTFWSTVVLGTGNEFTKSNFDGSAINVKKMGRFGNHERIHFDNYDGWHNVALEWSPLEYIYYVDGRETVRMSYKNTPMTTVPLHVIVSSEVRTPKSKKAPFYGRLEQAKLPDQAKFDYIRVYEINHGSKTAPNVTLEQLSPKTDEIKYGTPVTFKVTAADNDGTIKKIMLFSKGYLRDEITVNAAQKSHIFTIPTLFEGKNTIKAMAQDSDGLVGISTPITLNIVHGQEYTGTPYQGKPQVIPGTIVAGYYDEGGQNIAYKMYRNKINDPKCTWRIKEIGWSTETAIPCGGMTEPQWITYQVDVKEDGLYDVELLLNRPTYKLRDITTSETIQLDIDRKKACEWDVPINWHSGNGWRNPIKSLGQKIIMLKKGKHQLIVRFDQLKTKFTFFGGLNFSKN